MNHETRLYLTKHVKVTVGCSDMLMDFEFRKCCSCGGDERFVKVEVTCVLSLELLQLRLRNRQSEEREKSSSRKVRKMEGRDDKMNNGKGSGKMKKRK
jgi:hypothetical protein